MSRHPTPTRARYTVLGFTLALTAVSYLDRVCISMTGPFIQKDLELDEAQWGWVLSAFTLAYAVFEVPAGWLADRFGPRLMLTRVVVAAIYTKNALEAAWLLAIGGGLAAMGVAPAWAVCLEIGRKHAGVVTGTMNTFGNLGGTAIGLVVGYCLHWWNSWEISMMTVVFFYLFAAACWLAIDPTKSIPDTQ